MATMRGPHVYDIRNGMNFRDTNDLEPIHLRVSPSNPRFDNEDIQRQNGRYYNTRDNPPKKRGPFCTKRCVIGVIIGLSIGLFIGAAIGIPIGVVKYRYPLGTIFEPANWVGTYQTDTSCDTSSCCCLATQLVITEPNSQLKITAGVTGVCNNLPSYLSITQSIPSGFQLSVTWGGQVLDFQLGEDSTFISIVNINYPYCSATALRTSYSYANRKQIHLAFIFFTLLIPFGIIM